MALNFGKLNFSTSFNPTSAFPIDARQYFETYEAAQTAASTAVEAGSAESVYYFGMPLVVVEDGVATLYVIQPDKTLKPAGSALVGDNASIIVSDGVVSLDGFADATEGQQPRKATDGTIEWYTPDTSSVEGLQQTVGQLQTDVESLETTVAGKADASAVYTKEETDDKIDAAISSVYKPAGSVTFASLPTPGADNLGNVYNVTDAFTTDERFTEGTGIEYPAGTNVAIVQTSPEPATYMFDVLSGFVDLSDYVTSDEVAGTYATKTELGNKVDKVEGSSLVQDTLITKLQGLADIRSVATGELTISGSGELSVTAIAQDKITGLTEALADKVDAEEGMGLSENNFTDTLLEKLNGIETGAEVNVIESISLNSVPLEISGKAVNIPIATTGSLGVVQSSVAENGVTVQLNGAMEVNSVNVNKLVQTVGDTLVLNGGAANS